MPLLGIITSGVNDSPEELESLVEVSHTHTLTSAEHLGFQVGSIFSEDSLSNGDSHTCAISDNGSLFCWGDNQYGQLGTGTTTNYNTPQLINLVNNRSAVEVAAGRHYTCAILDDGSLNCWGNNAENQGGFGTFGNLNSVNSQPIPVPLGVGKKVIDIEVSHTSMTSHTCAILDDGSLMCWGNNWYGQVGDGTNIDENNTDWSFPTTIDLGPGRKTVAVALGDSHTCALLDNGSLKCWGHNGFGQLGLGYSNSPSSSFENWGVHTPQLVNFSNGRYPVAISSGYHNTCALLDNASLKCWGHNGFGQLGLGYSNGTDSFYPYPQTVEVDSGRQVIAIASGDYNSCMILDNNSLWCWGDNQLGELGLGYTSDSSSPSPSTPQWVNLSNVASVTMGAYHSCAILINGSLHCWGYNSWGNLGIGSIYSQAGCYSGTICSPHAVNLGSGEHISLSERDIDGDGILNIFDTHMPGMQEGHAFSRSTIATGGIDQGNGHTCAIVENGSLYCWGDNDYGQLGTGDTNQRNLPTYVNLGGSSVISVEAGTGHTCAIVENGSIYCWGRNHKGQLGNDNFVAFQWNPQLVNLSVGRTAVQVSAGFYHTCAVLDNGSVACWGLNSHGQLGSGLYGGNGDVFCGSGAMYCNGQSNPVYVRLDQDELAGLSNVSETAVAVSTGYQGSCAVVEDGHVRCWGANYQSLIPGGSNTPYTNPDLTSVVAVAVEDESACGLLQNGTVYCWGRGTEGQMGVNSTNNHYTGEIVSVQNLGKPVISIAAGYRNFCAILNDNTMKCWGQNSMGKLGLGNTTTQLLPVSVNTSGNVVSASTGGQHTCVIMLDSAMKCWGRGSEGQLGVNNGITLYDAGTATEIVFDSTIKVDSGDSDIDGDGFRSWFEDYPEDPVRSVNCPAGSYGRYSCVETTPGHYAPAASMYQTECDSGTYQPNTNQSSCISSSPGHYVPNPGSISQIPCPAGTYNPNNSSTNISDCILVDPGHYTTGSYQYEGFESGNLNGLFDNWSISSSLRNQPSPNHYSSSWQPTTTGECNTNNTLWCIQSNFSLNGGYSLRVGDDDYINSTTSSTGSQLPQTIRASVHLHVDFPQTTWFNFSYKVSNEGMWDHLNFCVRNTTEEIHCEHPNISQLPGSNDTGGVGPPNWNLNNSTWKRSWSSPVPDSNNLVNNDSASGDFSILIPAGQVTITWTYAKDGSVDRYFDSAWIDNITAWSFFGSPSQTECQPGTYQNFSGQIFCNDADPGHFVLNSASTIQSECLQGNYQPLPGQSSCLNASAGYYVPNSGSTNQTACPPGTYNPYIASINSTSCINTSPGYFAANAGSANQTACVPGTYQSNYNQTECIDSSPGFYVSNSGSANQTACSVGTYQPGTNQTNCMDSSPGYYVPNIGSSNQLICNSGTYQPSYGQSSCIDSSPGYYVSTSGQTTQSACTEGTYQPNFGQSSCIDSSPGYYVDNIAMSNQTACPGGTFNPNHGSISSNDCITTSPGYFASSGSGSQNPCQSGTYQPLTGQTNCTSTDPGYYVPGISYVLQLSCNPGTYQPNSGSSDCLIADAGYYVDSYSSDTQTACTAGTFNPVNGSSSYSSCIDTSPGYFTPISGMSEEYPCNPGTYQPLGGQDNCTNSSPGYFVPMNASTTQEPCIIGMYQPNYGRTYCEYPSPGYYVPTSSSSNQTRAEPGHYANANDNDTTTSHPCSLGYYQPYSGQPECIEADSGFYVDNNGSTTQIPCIGGTYNPNNGSISIDSCIDSIPGHYSKDGYSIYIPCELGFYQPNSGQSSCIEADSGFYVENNGSIDQIPCNEGTYNPNFGADSQDHCVQSNPGYHVPSPGSANQIPCIKGTYQPNFGESNCIPASLGYYVPVEGSISQIAADLDYYVDYTGSFTTTQCPEFYLTLETGSKTIDECLLDTDLDRNANIFDEDDDNDNILDVNDFCPAGQIDWISGFVNDQDIDGCKDSGEDLDDDNDGRLDENDAFPYDSFEQDDNDLDGQGDNLDIDDDNDGLSDILEYDLGTNQFDADTDGDGFNDKIDHFPLDGNEWVDTDGDGVGDNSDFMIEFARYQSKLDVTIDLIAVIIIILSLTVLYRKKTSESGPPPPPSKKPKKKLDSPPSPPSKKPKKKLDSPPLPPSKKPKKELESPSPPKSKNNN